MSFLLGEEQGRFKDAPFASKIPFQSVTIGGVGGIGSWLTLILAKMGFQTMSIYDFDVVEKHNLGGQFFSLRDAETRARKTTAIINTVGKIAQNIRIDNYGKFEESNYTNNITFACFDNMEARKHMFESWKKKLSEDARLEFVSEAKNGFDAVQLAYELDPDKNADFKDITYEDVYPEPIFIDIRMSAEQIHLGVFDKDNADNYEKHWFPDSDVEDGPCTYKATTFTGSMAASLGATALANKLAGRPVAEFSSFVLPQLLS